MAYTFTELLEDIKTRGMVPTSQNTYTSARFLILVNDEIRSSMLPLVLKCRANYFEYNVDTALDSTGTYPISTRAIGGKVNNLALISGTQRLDLPWGSEEELSDTSVSPTGTAVAYIKGNQVITVPQSISEYTTLRMGIYLRPSEVVAQSSAAQITAINTGTRTLTFTSGTVPSSWTTSMTFDLVQQNPHFDTLAIDQAISTITTTTMIFSSALPSRLAVGDWVGLAGQSPIIQLPLELHPLLAQRVANECLKNSPHTKAYETGIENVKEMEKNAMHLLTPRIDKEGKKLVNRTGMLRRGM